MTSGESNTAERTWHPLSPQLHSLSGQSYFSHSQQVDQSTEEHDERDGRTPRPSVIRPAVVQADAFTENVILRLSRAPHSIKLDALAREIYAIRGEGDSLEKVTSLHAARLLAALSAKTQESNDRLQRQLASAQSQTDALLELLRKQSSISEQLIERTLVRASTEALEKFTLDKLSEIPEKRKHWELRIPGTKKPTRHTSRDRTIGSPVVGDSDSIHSAVEEAMSESQFDAKSLNSTSIFDTQSSFDGSVANSSKDEKTAIITRHRNSSLSARIFAGFGSISRSVKPDSPSDIVEEEPTIDSTLKASARATLPATSPTDQIDQSMDTTTTPPRKSAGLTDWAGNMFTWSNKGKRRESLPVGNAEVLAVDHLSVKGQTLSTDFAKRSPSSISVASHSTSSTSTLAHSQTDLSSVAPSLSKNNAVTMLISKRQIDNPTLSIPVDAPLPALSNPASLLSSPSASHFPELPDQMTRSLSLGASSNADRPPHFNALMLAASEWVVDGRVHHKSQDKPSLQVQNAASGLVAGVADEQGILEKHLDRPSLNRATSAPGLVSDVREDSGRDYMTTAKDAIGRALGLSKAAKSLSAHVSPTSSKPLSPSKGKIEPTVTLPTLGLTRQASVFQGALSPPVISSSMVPSASNNISNALGTDSLTVEMAPIGGSEVRPPKLSDQQPSNGMAEFVDRYGFMHEKYGIRTMREMRQKQDEGSSPSDGPEDGPNSMKRLLAHLDESDESKERAQKILWDEFVRKRRLKTAQSFGADENSPARKNRQSVLLSENTVGAAALSIGASGGATDDLAYTANMLGVARMGTSGKSGKEAFKELKKLVKAGIPACYRPAIWSELSGATDLKEPGYYQELLSKNVADADSLCLKQINADVGRTFGNNVFFGGDGPGVAKLRRVLIAYSWHNPEVGYCQGMNLLAGTLLLALPTEEDAFWILCCVIERILPSDYYTPSLLVSRADQRVLRDLVAKELPTLSQHFQTHGVELEAVTFGWFLSLYSMCLPVQRVATAILQLNADELLTTSSSSDLYMLMRSMASAMHQADKLIKTACDDYKHTIKTKDINTLRETHVAQMQAET